jgi:hypothetical protein
MRVVTPVGTVAVKGGEKKEDNFRSQKRTQTRVSSVSRGSLIWGDGRGRDKVRHAVVRLGVRCVRWVVSSEVGVRASVHVDIVDSSRVSRGWSRHCYCAVRDFRVDFKGNVHSEDARTSILSCTAVGCLRLIAVLYFYLLLVLAAEDFCVTDTNHHVRVLIISGLIVPERCTRQRVSRGPTAGNGMGGGS